MDANQAITQTAVHALPLSSSIGRVGPVSVTSSLRAKRVVKESMSEEDSLCFGEEV